MMKAGCYLWLGLLTWCVGYIRSITDTGDVESARCRVRCLAHLKHKLGGSGNAEVTFEKCFQDTACTACVKPCSQPFISLSHCVQLCQDDEEECELSCRFLKHLRTVHPGSCPHPDDARGFDSACVESCKNDGECNNSQKCCNNGCGMTCQMSQGMFTGVPEIPRMPRIRERPKSGTVELSWKAVMTNLSAPILYMVQTRWNVGKHHSEHHMSDWSQVSQTTETSHVIRDVGPGRWYEFRVGAVSVNGTRGFSPHTKAFKLSKEPSPPGPPQNLTEGRTVIKDKKIHLTIHWQPPKTSDLPIGRYKVYWSRRLKSVTAELVSLREKKKVVPGHLNQFTLEDLEPDTTYFIQVTAISAYGDTRLKSERASTYITTYALQQATQDAAPTAVVEIKALVTLPALKNIDPGTPYFHNGLLKANISWDEPNDFTDDKKILLHWSPQVCIDDNTGSSSVAKAMSATTHETYFIIYDLRFDCRYVVKLQIVSTQGEIGALSHISFTAPSCGDVEVHGDIQPDCPTNVPRVPDQPPGLKHSFLIVNTNITAKISWQEPESDAPLSGYRIIWGQTLPVNMEPTPTLDQNTALTKVLSKETDTFHIGNLQEATVYMVHLQAFSSAGSGKAAHIHFSTPVLQPQPMAPPYKTEGEHKSRNKNHDNSFGTTPSGRSTWPSVLKPEESVASSSACDSQSNRRTVFTALLILLYTTWLTRR